MDLPAIQLLYLEQGDHLLEALTWDFLHLVCQTDGPKEDFAAFVEWVLVNNNSPFTIGPAEDDSISSPTPPLPETSLPPPASDVTEKLHVSTADRGD